MYIFCILTRSIYSKGENNSSLPKVQKTNKQTNKTNKKERKKTKQQTLNIPFHKLDNIFFLFMLNYNIFFSFCQKKWGRGKHIARFHNVNARKKLQWVIYISRPASSYHRIYYCIKVSMFIIHHVIIH